jgi:biopolymer transport protein ExbD
MPDLASSNGKTMDNPIKAVIVDDDTVVIDGCKLVKTDEIADALRSALQSDPNIILVIEPTKNEYYRGIGKVIYASQHVGMPVENLRYTNEDGEVLTFDELRARNPTPSV